MADNERRVTLSVEELALSNSVTLNTGSFPLLALL
jgi:hypothetical protein